MRNHYSIFWILKIAIGNIYFIIKGNNIIVKIPPQVKKVKTMMTNTKKSQLFEETILNLMVSTEASW